MFVTVFEKSTRSQDDDNVTASFCWKRSPQNIAYRWSRCFEGIHAVFFIIDITTYDIISETNTNSLRESLGYFEDNTSRACLRESVIVLIFNKM